MTIQHSDTVRNACLDAVETAVGTGAILKIYDLSGSAPANCAASISGTVIATLTLPSDWMAASSGGSKAKSGTWEDASADNDGTADFFRLFASNGTTCHQQGTVTTTGGGGDMTVANTTVTAGMAITITGYTLTDGNG